jgi:glucosamine 6-phosphate synthetase-like amidotransferase/phosphosugar isomerase protein
MCAIFGYLAKKGKRVGVADLARIAAANVGRGPHAFGFAWVTADGRLRCYKQAGRVTDYIGLLAMARDAVALVGHLRYATHGSPGNNLNNHPHPCDGGWLVHNGVVGNYESLLTRRKLNPVSECDSEAIAQLVEVEEGKLAPRVGAALEECDGAHAVLGLWARPVKLIAGRAGNPLHQSFGEEGHYFATMANGLPGNVQVVPSDAVVEYSYNAKGHVNASVTRIATEVEALPLAKGRRASYSLAGGPYRGG